MIYKTAIVLLLVILCIILENKHVVHTLEGDGGQEIPKVLIIMLENGELKRVLMEQATQTSNKNKYTLDILEIPDQRNNSNKEEEELRYSDTVEPEEYLKVPSFEGFDTLEHLKFEEIVEATYEYDKKLEDSIHKNYNVVIVLDDDHVIDKIPALYSKFSTKKTPWIMLQRFKTINETQKEKLKNMNITIHQMDVLDGMYHLGAFCGLNTANEVVSLFLPHIHEPIAQQIETVFFQGIRWASKRVRVLFSEVFTPSYTSLYRWGMRHHGAASDLIIHPFTLTQGVQALNQVSEPFGIRIGQLFDYSWNTTWGSNDIVRFQINLGEYIKQLFQKPHLQVEPFHISLNDDHLIRLYYNFDKLHPYIEDYVEDLQEYLVNGTVTYHINPYTGYRLPLNHD